MKEIIDTICEYYIVTEGIGVELHPDNVTPTVLYTLKNAGVTKISIGVQSFQGKFQSILGRNIVNADKLSEALSQVPFETVSMDFIFALPSQTFEDLKADVDTAFRHGANHIAIYPFIDFTFTASKVSALPKIKKRVMLDEITKYCLDKGYIRNSIWTFSREKQAKYSSMTRDNFLGFGCSSTTLLKDQFKINTFSAEEYCKRIDAEKLPTSLTIRFTLRQRMVYFLFWTAYSTKVNARDFERFFGLPLKKGAFYYHYYENFYTLHILIKCGELCVKKRFLRK